MASCGRGGGSSAKTFVSTQMPVHSECKDSLPPPVRNDQLGGDLKLTIERTALPMQQMKPAKRCSAGGVSCGLRRYRNCTAFGTAVWGGAQVVAAGGAEAAAL